MSADEGFGSELADIHERVADDPRVDTAIDAIADVYHLIAVGVAMVFMFWVRARNWGQYVIDGRVLYSGNDPWYHYRMVQYTIRHFPETMPYDVWTYFPRGTSVGQFGTLMDQVIALAALIVGLGSPDPELVRMVHLFAPAAIGTVVAVPAYFLARRMGGRTAGVLAVITLALVGVLTQGGSTLIKGLVGTSDHQIAEALLAGTAGVAIVTAIQVADREKPVVELLADRDIAGLRRPVGYGALAGVAIALYMSLWPPAIYFVGLLGIYVTLQAIVTVAQGDHPEPILLVTAVTFGVAGLVPIGTFDVLDIRATKISLFHIGLPIAGAVWSVGLLWLARLIDERDLSATDAATSIEEIMGVAVTDRRASRIGYAVAVLGTLGAVALVAKLVTPELFSYAVSQFMRVAGIIAQKGASGTIGEVQRLQRPGVLFEAYRVAIVLAGGLIGWTVLWRIPSGTNRPERLFVAIWFVFSLSMTLTQGRFMYYLAVPTVGLAGVAGSEIIDVVLEAGEDESGLTGFEVISIAAVLILLVGPLAVPPNVVSMTKADNLGPGGGVRGWQSSLQYLESDTPKPGAYGTAQNAEKLDYLAENAVEADADYDYPEGSYGVISWWDYGHWITTLGKRIPTANPFQEGATQAAQFLLATNESQAEREIADVSDSETAQTRYVAVDYKMALTNSRWGGKFFAPPNFVENKSISDYRLFVRGIKQTESGLRYIRFNESKRVVVGTIQRPAYYHTMTTRLYRYHGSMKEPRPIVTDWTMRRGTNSKGEPVSINVIPTSKNKSLVRTFGSMEAAQSYVQNHSTSQIGGIGGLPNDRVPALEHYRLVNVSTESGIRIGEDTRAAPFLTSQPGLYTMLRKGADLGLSYGTIGALAERNPAWTKIFERVPGATIQGEGPPNSYVYASVRMKPAPTNAAAFTYTQRARTDAQGNFEMTVPYATTGTERWGPEDGATNVSVRATGPYTITTDRRPVRGTVWNATTHVSNAKVIGRDEAPVRVELERHETSTGSQNVTVST